MDPDACLELLREALDEAKQDATDVPDELHGIVNRIRDHFEDLDEWLKTGGFLPKDWGIAPRQVE